MTEPDVRYVVYNEFSSLLRPLIVAEYQVYNGATGQMDWAFGDAHAVGNLFMDQPELES